MSAPPRKTPPRRRRLGLYGLLAAHGVSLSGNALTQVALPWYVLATTGSAAQTGLVAFAGTVPLVLAAFFGGAVVDRLGQRRVSVVSDLASGLTVAAIPLLALTLGLPFPILLALVALGALLDPPGVTARETLLPDLAAHAGMRPERANAAFETIQGGALLVGPLLAGVLIAAVGAAGVLWVNAATFALSALLVTLTIRAPATKPAPRNSYGRDLLDGLRVVFGDRLIRLVTALSTLLWALVAPLFSVVMPIYVRETSGRVSDLGLFLATIGGGTILGAVGYGAVGHRLSQRVVFGGGLVGVAAGFGLLATVPARPLLLTAALLIGVAAGPLNPIVNTVFQRRTAPEQRGRVFGTSNALALATAPLGVVGAGFLVEAIGFQATLVGIAVGFAVVTLATLSHPTLRLMDAPPQPRAKTPPPVLDPRPPRSARLGRRAVPTRRWRRALRRPRRRLALPTARRRPSQAIGS